MISWFGFTERTISSIIIYTMIFPVVFNTMIGVRTVPTVVRDAARSMGAGWFRIIRDVYVPGSFPSVMTGLRLGIGFGWRALIAGEFVVGGGGLGFLIFDARTAGIIERVMLGMIVLGALWLLIDRLILRPVEEYTAVKWGMVRQ
jgi:NitT/TauT family transport system permease protein/taurine transport system permease protein